MLKLVIFDLDGTLVDSIDVWNNAYFYIFKKYKIKLTKRQILEQYGKSDIDIFNSLIKNKKIREMAIKEFYAYKNSKEFIKKFKLHKNSRRVLNWLKKRGYKIALATGNRKDFCFKILKKLKLEKYFDIILTFDDVKKGKPNPEIIKKCLKLARVKENEAIYICDSLSDLIAAKKAKIKTCLVSWGSLGKRNKLADFCLKEFSISELKRVLEN